jgi:hypothetical protein
MSIERDLNGSNPVRPEGVGRLDATHELRRDLTAWHLATGTLACPSCDAPVAPIGTMAPHDPLSCPVCEHAGALRDFLSLTAPTRPARVEVRVVHRADRPRRFRRAAA